MMRTYNRKPPEFRPQEDVRDLCRLCLAKCKKTVPIFTEAPDSMFETIPLKIMMFIGLEITQDDRLSNAICTECHQELERYYAFRKKCLAAYRKLKAYVQGLNEFIKTEVLVENRKTKFKKIKQEITPAAIERSDQSDVNDDKTLIVLINKDEQTELVDNSSIDMSIVKTEENELYSIWEQETSHPVLKKEMQDEEDKKPSAEEKIHDVNVNDLLIPVVSVDLTKQDGDKTKPQCLKSKRPERRGCVRAGERPFACRRCGQRFALRTTARRHELVHDEIRPHRCTICSKTYTQSYALYKHKFSHVPPQERKLVAHQCITCSKVFRHASSLSRHMLMHKGRVYSCEACSWYFKDHKSMRRHMRKVHETGSGDERSADSEEIRVYRCTLSYALERHKMISHAPQDERKLGRYQCHRCPKVFQYSSGLSRHVMMHRGRMYACDFCDDKFTDQSSMKRHMKTLH